MTAVLYSPQGDDLRLAERLIVAPVAGVFRPHPPEVITAEGEIVHDGQSLGLIDGPGQSVDVVSFATGYLMGMLAEPGQRVRPGQPVAWLRALNGGSTRWS
jgi:multidrug efflux pump subunit AcrA (membrane-fusion protein)